MLFMYCLHSGKLQNTLTCPTELALPRALAADADCDDIIYALTNTHVWSLRLTPGTAAAIWGVPLQFAAGAALLAAGSGIVVTVQETNHYTFAVSVLSRADGSSLSTFTHGGDCVSVGVMNANAILLGSSWFYGGCRLYTQTGDDILEVTTGLFATGVCAPATGREDSILVATEALDMTSTCAAVKDEILRATLDGRVHTLGIDCTETPDIIQLFAHGNGSVIGLSRHTCYIWTPAPEDDGA
jgi:hypothetical protein